MSTSIDHTRVMPEEFEEGHILGTHYINRTDGSGDITELGIEQVHLLRLTINGAELKVRTDNAVTLQLTEEYARRLGLALIAATDQMSARTATEVVNPLADISDETLLDQVLLRLERASEATNENGTGR